MNASTLEGSHTIHLDLMALREALFMDSNGTTCNDRSELNSPDECLRSPMDSKRILSPLFTHRAIGWYSHLRDKHRSLRACFNTCANVVALPVIGCRNELSFQDKRHGRHPNYEFGARVRHFLLSK